jgi:hypothetical protein
MDEERSVMAPNAKPDESSPTRPQRSSTKCRRGRPTKYTFNDKDDVYISKCRIGGARWKDIKNGKKKWKDWPIHAFRNRWRLIKDKGLHLQEMTVTPKDSSGSGAASRKQIHRHPKPPPNVGKKRGMGSNVKKMKKDVSEDGWSTDELAM